MGILTLSRLVGTIAILVVLVACDGSGAAERRDVPGTFGTGPNPATIAPTAAPEATATLLPSPTPAATPTPAASPTSRPAATATPAPQPTSVLDDAPVIVLDPRHDRMFPSALGIEYRDTLTAALHARAALEAAGFELRRREPEWEEHRLLTADAPARANLHVWSPGAIEPRRHLAFRDWLRAHPDDRAAYAAVKAELGARGFGDGNDYNNHKAGFVYDLYERIFAADPEHEHTLQPRGTGEADPGRRTARAR